MVTLFVIAAALVMARLGVWQLDRLEGRRAFNSQVLEMRALQPLDINHAGTIDLGSQIYREALVVGEYDFENQIVLGNQVHGDQHGVHLLTPLRVNGGERVILVDRGWVPYNDYLDHQLEQYNYPGSQTAQGMLTGSQDRIGIRDCIGDGTDPGAVVLVWCVDLPAIEQQMPYPLEDIYLLQAPTTLDDPLPVGTTVQIDTSEGMHLSYAVQWFSFAALLIVGYPIFVHRETVARQKRATQVATKHPASTQL